MIYRAILKKSELCDCGCEGNTILIINDFEINTYFQVDNDFYRKVLGKNETDIDLWLVYGTPKKLESPEMKLPTNIDVCGGTLKGKVVSINSNTEFCLDCGILIDVDSESIIKGIVDIGDYIEIQGTYQIFFPGTEYSRE